MHLLAAVIHNEFEENGVLPDGDINGDVLSLTFDGEVKVHLSPLMFSRVREEG